MYRNEYSPIGVEISNDNTEMTTLPQIYLVISVASPSLPECVSAHEWLILGHNSKFK